MYISAVFWITFNFAYEIELVSWTIKNYSKGKQSCTVEKTPRSVFLKVKVWKPAASDALKCLLQILGPHCKLSKQVASGKAGIWGSSSLELPRKRISLMSFTPLLCAYLLPIIRFEGHESRLPWIPCSTQHIAFHRDMLWQMQLCLCFFTTLLSVKMQEELICSNRTLCKHYFHKSLRIKLFCAFC